MANQDDIQALATEAAQTEDVARLRQIRDELLNIAQSMSQAALRSEDATVRTMATELRDSAQNEAEEVRQRAAQLEIDQMDPQYEARRAARVAAKEAEDQKGREMVGGFMKTLMGEGGGGGGGGGLGKLLGGLMGSKDETAAHVPTAPDAPEAAPPAPSPAPSPGVAPGTACSSCGAALTPGAKFCPECGAKAGPAMCTGCGAELPPTGRFCPSCGAPRA